MREISISERSEDAVRAARLVDEGRGDQRALFAVEMSTEEPDMTATTAQEEEEEEEKKEGTTKPADEETSPGRQDFLTSARSRVDELKQVKQSEAKPIADFEKAVERAPETVEHAPTSAVEDLVEAGEIIQKHEEEEESSLAASISRKAEAVLEQHMDKPEGEEGGPEPEGAALEAARAGDDGVKDKPSEGEPSEAASDNNEAEGAAAVTPSADEDDADVSSVHSAAANVTDVTPDAKGEEDVTTSSPSGGEEKESAAAEAEKESTESSVPAAADATAKAKAEAEATSAAVEEPVAAVDDDEAVPSQESAVNGAGDAESVGTGVEMTDEVSSSAADDGDDAEKAGTGVETADVVEGADEVSASAADDGDDAEKAGTGVETADVIEGADEVSTSAVDDAAKGDASATEIIDNDAPIDGAVEPKVGDDTKGSPEEAPTEPSSAAPDALPAVDPDETASPSISDAVPVAAEEDVSTEAGYDRSTYEKRSDLLRGLDHSSVSQFHSFGMDTRRRYNFHLMPGSSPNGSGKGHVLLHIAGNSVQLFDLSSMSIVHTLPGLDGRGIGAVAVHPSKEFFAVGEKGENPNIYIYSYPDLVLTRVLRGGTDVAFSVLTFNNDGTKLASVGSYPDFWLTVWNWQNESILLRSKAFSQEVFSVSFSPFVEGRLVTSGTGHIRFWKMAATFTGFKLQGEIGKFGSVELSDVAGFAELPSGKVLSGTEAGSLLLWDGGMIKAVVCLPGGGNCHDGAIELVRLDESRASIVSAGADGKIKYWSLTAIDSAIIPEGSNLLETEPTRTIVIGSGPNSEAMLTGTGGDYLASIRDIVPFSDSFSLVHDANGLLWHLGTETGAAKKVVDYHAGGIVGCVPSPVSHHVVTAGEDGSVRLYDYTQKKQLYSRRFGVNTACTCVAPVPLALDASGRSTLVGFADGIVRVVRRCRDGFRLAASCKPHRSSVTCMGVSPDAKLLATGSDDQTVFLLRCVPPPASPEDGTATGGGEIDRNIKLLPIGYVVVSGAITSMAWRKPEANDNDDDEGLLMLGCETGDVLGISRPSAEVLAAREAAFEANTLSSYEMNLHSVFYDFTRPSKRRLRQCDEDDMKLPEVSDDKEKGAMTSPRTTPSKVESGGAGAAATLEQPSGDYQPGEAGEDGGAQDGEAEEEEEEEEEEEDSAFSVTSIFCMDNGNFLLGLSGRGVSGYLFECSLDNDEVVRVYRGAGGGEENSTAATTTVISASTHDTRVMTLGSSDGCVSVLVPRSSDDDDLSRAMRWHGRVHDADHGSVTSCTTSFDSGFIISTSADGSFFVHSLKLPGTLSLEYKSAVGSEAILGLGLSSMPMRSADGDGAGAEPPDLPARAYSFEESKRRSEQDAAEALAEDHKTAIRARVTDIKRRFDEIVAENDTRAEEDRIDRESLDIDPELKRIMEEQARDRLEITRKELAWSSEYHATSLNKLKAHFLDRVGVEKVVLKAFLTKMSVSTFRTAKMSDKMAEELEQIKDAERGRMTDDASRDASGGVEASAHASGSGDNDGSGNGSGVGAGAGDDASGGAKASDPSSTSAAESAAAAAAEKLASSKEADAAEAKQLGKVEQRRLLRRRRQQEWESFNATRPDESLENPEDVRLIDEARATMGDFKLKSDPNYIVPEEQRVNAMKKRRQMVLLEEAMLETKKHFNTRFFALREEKKSIIEEINVKSRLIERVENEYGIKEKLFYRLSDAGMTKWSRNVVGTGHAFEPRLSVEEEPERRFTVGNTVKERFEEFLAKREEEERGGSKGGMGLSGAKKSKAESDAEMWDIIKEEADVERTDSEDVSANESEEDAETGDHIRSDMEHDEERIRRVRQEHERSVSMEHIIRRVRNFDNEVSLLRQDKFLLEADLKGAELKRLVLYKELILLKEFEKRDTSLKERMDTKRGEESELLAKIHDCQKKLNAKDDELTRLSDRKRHILSEFDSIVEEGNAFREPLLRIFLRRIKRTKKKASDEDEEYDSEEEDDEDDDDEDFNDEDDEEVCPPGCEQALYERVCDLREKRLDQDDVINECQRSIDAFKKEKESLLKKQKIIEQSLRTIDAEIIAFQKEKQAKLNEIDVVVTLKMSQIQYLEEDGRLPSDISAALVFSNKTLERLRHRIKELVHEKAGQKSHQKELRKEHVNLSREKRAKEEKIHELSARAYDVQMLKFGQVIDLDVFDRIGSNKVADDMKETLHKQERAQRTQLAEWQVKTETTQSEYANVTMQHTEYLERIAALTRRQRELEKAVRATQSTIFTDPSEQRAKEIQERDRLVLVVNKQATEIQHLRNEIQRLRMK